MNPLTNVKNQQKLNERELALGLTNKKSWHDQYKDSAWIFVGGLPYDLSEGDILCVFSQYGEIVNVNLVRDQKTGKSKGFCFICYEDQRSTILSVDNLNGFKLLGRILRVDHVEEYRKPKDHGDEDDLTRKLRDEGCAPKLPDSSPELLLEEEDPLPVMKAKKEKKKKMKKEKKKKKKKKVRHSSSEESDSDMEEEEDTKPVNVKKEKYDPGYEKALKPGTGVRKRSLSSDSSSDSDDDDDDRHNVARMRGRDDESDRNRQDKRGAQGYREHVGGDRERQREYGDARGSQGSRERDHRDKPEKYRDGRSGGGGGGQGSRDYGGDRDRGSERREDRRREPDRGDSYRRGADYDREERDRGRRDERDPDRYSGHRRDKDTGRDRGSRDNDRDRERSRDYKR